MIHLAMMSRKRVRARSVKPAAGTVAVSQGAASYALAQKVNRLTKLVKGIQPELKFYELNSAFSNIADTAGAVTSIVGVPQGDAINNRTGNKIRIKKLYVQARVATNTGSIGVSPTNEEFSRVFVVQDLQQASDTDPVPSNVVAVVSLPQTLLDNVQLQGQFKILWASRLIHHARIAQTSLSGALTVPLAPTESPVVIMNKKVDIPVTFNGTAGADLQKNGIFLMVTTSLAADTLDVGFYTRASYIDD